MSQDNYSFTWLGTSTGGFQIKTGPTVLHTIVIGSTGSAAVYNLYNATSSGTATARVTAMVNPTPGTYIFDITCPNGLFLGQTSSTADATISWA